MRYELSLKIIIEIKSTYFSLFSSFKDFSLVIHEAFKLYYESCISCMSSYNNFRKVHKQDKGITANPVVSQTFPH